MGRRTSAWITILKGYRLFRCELFQRVQLSTDWCLRRLNPVPPMQHAGKIEPFTPNPTLLVVAPSLDEDQRNGGLIALPS
jgi:hypothetical protein